MHLLFFLVTISLLASRHAADAASSMGQCPSSNLITPCTCSISFERLSIACHGLTSPHQLVNVFKEVPSGEWRFLTISNSSFLHIPSSIFENTGDVSLHIENSTLASIFDRPPTSGSFTNLSIKNSALLSGFEWRLFTPVKKVQIIYVENTRIRKLSDGTRDGIPESLSMLFLIKANVTRINQDVLTKSNLVAFVLRRGMLRTIENLRFPAGIKVINFRNNRIESLPNELFKTYPSLMTVILVANSITTLKKEALLDMKETEVDLRSNPIICNCDFKWIADMNLNETNIYATCAEPIGVKGKPVKDLTSLDFNYCTAE